jgi:HEAT repeat protein
LADALGSTTSGWKEILSLMENDEVDTGRRLILIRSLGLVPRPGEEVVALLSSLASREDDAFSAIMAIRSLGLSAGIPDNLDQKEGLAQELIPLLGGPVERDVQVLNALGNAGSIESLPAILGLAGSSSEEVRAAVAIAVRKLEAPQVEPLLVKLAADSSVSVRLSAVSILVERDGPNTSTLLKKICAKDPNEGVRLEAIEYFAGCSSQNVSAVQVLTDVSLNDPSENVRTYASNALKNMAAE